MLIINLDRCIGVTFDGISDKGVPSEDTLINLHFSLKHAPIIEAMLGFCGEESYDSSFYVINNKTGKGESIFPLDMEDNSDKYTPVHYFVTIGVDCPLFQQAFDKFYPSKTNPRN